MLMLPPSTTPHLDRLPSFAELHELLQLVAPGAAGGYDCENEGRAGSTLAQRDVGSYEVGDTRVSVCSMVLDNGKVDVRVRVMSIAVELHNSGRHKQHHKRTEVAFVIGIAATASAAIHEVTEWLTQWAEYHRTTTVAACARLRARRLVAELPVPRKAPARKAS